MEFCTRSKRKKIHFWGRYGFLRGMLGLEWDYCTTSKSRSSSDVVKWWTSHEHFVNRLWTNHEQVINKSWTSYEQIVNRLSTSHGCVLKKYNTLWKAMKEVKMVNFWHLENISKCWIFFFDFLEHPVSDSISCSYFPIHDEYSVRSFIRPHVSKAFDGRLTLSAMAS